LSTNLGKLAELQKEIRSTFTNQEEIEISLLQMLPYLTAVIEEGLRIFPPTAFGLPRLSPGAMVDGNFVPNGVCSTILPTHRYKFYFHRTL
jgi:cytochrome P450